MNTYPLSGFAIAAIALLVLAGCGAKKDDTRPPTEDISTPTSSSPSLPGSSTPYVFKDNGANVNAKMFGKAWPLTVRSGRVNCIPVAGGNRLVMVVFTANNDTRYAVNGTARSRASIFGFKDVQAIWADDPSAGGLKKDISVLIDVCAPLMG